MRIHEVTDILEVSKLILKRLPDSPLQFPAAVL